MWCSGCAGNVLNLKSENVSLQIHKIESQVLCEAPKCFMHACLRSGSLSHLHPRMYIDVLIYAHACHLFLCATASLCCCSVFFLSVVCLR